MKIYTAHLKGSSPYSQSKYYNVEKLEKESASAFEERTWRERLHVNANGNVFIPPMSIKICLSEAAKYLGITIPGKGKNNYPKHFEAGVMVTDAIVLGIKKEDVAGEWLFVPSDGKRGGGKRVNKCFPIIHVWEGDVQIYVIDETVTKEVLLLHLEQAGKFIGLGRFRPRNNGWYGRFTVESLV